LRLDPLTLNVMMIAKELHLSEEEVWSWKPPRLQRWLAFNRIMNEEEKKAIDRAKQAGKR